MKYIISSCYKYLLLLMLSLTFSLGGGQADFSEPTVRLSGHVPHKAVANSVLVDNLDADRHVPLTFVLPLRNQEALEELIKRIYDPADKAYGKYLTSDEFVKRFSPTQEDYDNVIAYAKQQGFVISSTHPNRTLLNVRGPTASIESAFDLNLHHYQTASGRNFYAPNKNPQVPVSIASIINGIVGLDNHAVWRAFHRKKQTSEIKDGASQHIETSNSTSHSFPSGPGGGYAPADIVTAYDLEGLSVNGSGQIIALFELAGYQASDINQYTSHFGLAPAKLHNVLVDGGSYSGIDPEVTLDIELALALAPESTIYVYEGPNSNQGVLDTYNRIATDNIAKQVSTSWGIGEDLESSQYLQAEQAIFLQMAAHGQSIYAAAGDSGAYDDSSSSSPTVDDPASQPYVVGVGGTRLTVNRTTGVYESETVWNNGPDNGAGGGGVSVVWPIPSWQNNVSTTFSKTHRNVPDVALNADPDTGYSIYYDGQWTIYGGTSCAAPLWAAFTALINQERVASQQAVLGFANPSIYSIGTSTSYSVDFHDVTSGNNLYYAAGNGYDNASGWGSFNGINLFASLTNSTPPPSPPPTLIPALNITMTHNAPFIKGEIGTYQIGIGNQGTGSTSGPVTVTVTLPTGLTYRSFSGAGWSFNSRTLTFTQTNVLNAGSSYPTLVLEVNVNSHALSSVISSASVSGGGSTSSSTSDFTTIL